MEGGGEERTSGIHLEKNLQGEGKSMSKDILGVCAYSEQYSILKG